MYDSVLQFDEECTVCGLDDEVNGEVTMARSGLKLRYSMDGGKRKDQMQS